ETDATGADQRDLRSHRLAARDRVDVTDHLRMVDAGNRRRARDDAGGDHHVLETGQVAGSDAPTEPDVDVELLQSRAEVTQRLAELLLEIGRASCRESVQDS